ncbi:MAG: alpha-glucosidase [Acholeplasmataceae bacterium]|jgi:oligo-1,6-glucosidase
MKLWQKGVVYQIYPRSFKDYNGDGIGDINGITSMLDYLNYLGIDIIWLSPVYLSPNRDFGYDVADYYQINPEYGTMEDMDNLIKKADKLGIKIIMDLVINHTSTEHWWFQEAIKSKDNPYRDYYHWRDKKNNWGGFFGGTTWEKVGDQYYLHLFDKTQADLNLSNPKVIKEIKDIMTFWLDKGIYGFRCDVINIIYKNSLENGKRRLVLTGLEHYHSTERNHEILQELRRDVLDNYDTFTVGETVLVTPEQALDLMAPERKELDLVISFEHMDVDHINNKWFKVKYKPKKLMQALTKWQEALPWNCLYFENHDQPRSVSRFGSETFFRAESAKMLAVLLLTLRGTPFIYQGQEIGMTNGDFQSIDEIMDTETHNIRKLGRKLLIPPPILKKMLLRTTRDNARTPMQWDDTRGFTSGTPWLKENENKSYINVKNELRDDNSILHFYKKLIAFRKANPALISGDFKVISMKNDIYIYERSYEKQAFRMIINMSGKIKKFQCDKRPVVSNYNSFLGYQLRPYEALIISLKR